MKKFFTTLSIVISLFCFHASAQLGSNGYYRIINKQTGKTVSIADNEFSVGDILSKCGGGRNLADNAIIKYTGNFNGDNSYYGDSLPAQTAAFIHVGKYLAKDIKLVESTNSIYDVGSIIYISENNATNHLYDLSSQNTKLSEITNQGCKTSFLPVTIPAHYAIITNSGYNTYTLSLNLKVRVSFATKNLGTKFFVDNNNKFAIDDTGSASNNGQWEIIPVTQAKLATNFIAVKTIESNMQNGKYYTTLRTAFPFTVPTSSTLKVYRVSAIPSIAGGVATLVQYESGSIIPAGLPVIIESEDLDVDYNKILPSSSAGTSATTALYNNYGVNDNEIDVTYVGTTYNPTNLNEGSGDKIGYFHVKKYTGSTTLYKFGIRDGRVGFWDQVQANEIINGNEAYSPVQCALFPEIASKSLADIIEEGSKTTYEVNHSLYGVKVVDGKLYAKDKGKYANPSDINIYPNAIDYMSLAHVQDAYDQSNWVALSIPSETNLIQFEKKDIQVIGSLMKKPNPEMTVTKITATAPEQSGYTPNVYIPASFMGETQTSTVGNQNTYFFVTPKPQEYAHITWAVYGGDGKFYIAEPQGSVNQAALKGGFVADGSLIGGLTSFESGETYKFDAIIQVNPSSKSPYTTGGYSTGYTVYPTSAPTVITAVNDVNMAKTVTGIKYYNLAGVASDQPFDGINIVVTTYSDGTRQASKIRF